MDKKSFLKLAGGVYTNNKDYSSLKSAEKQKLFWDFFDRGFGKYIHSVYMDSTIAGLMKNNRTIEHIIPRSWGEYFPDGTLENVKNGFTTNPLNFVVAHRSTNSSRQARRFDLGGDNIRLTAIRNICTECGLDDDGEWVVPNRSEGNLARAVLYMHVVYGIPVLDTGRLNTFRNWAKLDPPNIWEIKYNQWVHKNHGIKNPFISYDNPAQAFNFLDNDNLFSIKK